MPERTGTIRMLDGEANLVLTRTFAMPASRVWRWMTDSDRLSQWIGHWEGDPASGEVAFFMTAEGEVVEPERYQIRECDPPRRFAGDTSLGEGAWHLWFEITEHDGAATLTFGQRLNPGEDVGSIGPGWEYYLDRMAAAAAGEAVDGVAWDAYFPALQGEYQALME